MTPRIGLAAGYDPTVPVATQATWMREAEQHGFELGFFSETLMLLRDAPTALAAYALATERLRIGATMVVRLRSAVVMAQTAATLDELSGGRLVLAPGACTSVHAERHELPPAPAGAALVEWVATMRALLRGEDVRGVALGWRPVRPHVPFLIPATTRNGLRRAGQIGDGVLLPSVASPEFAANAIEIVHDAVEEAGRDWDSFEVAQLVTCAVTDDRDTALAAVRREVATKFSPLQLPSVLRSARQIGEPYVTDADAKVVAAAWTEGGPAAAQRALPEHVLAGVTAAGTPNEVRACIDRYRAAGVKLPIVRPVVPDHVRAILELLSC